MDCYGATSNPDMGRSPTEGIAARLFHLMCGQPRALNVLTRCERPERQARQARVILALAFQCNADREPPLATFATRSHWHRFELPVLLRWVSPPASLKGKPGDLHRLAQ